jgi:predicted DNA-binding ribbon-helix-helix protein
MKRVNRSIYIDVELWDRLRHLAIDRHTTASALVERLVAARLAEGEDAHASTTTARPAKT